MKKFKGVLNRLIVTVLSASLIVAMMPSAIAFAAHRTALITAGLGKVRNGRIIFIKH